jgi:hypothetical protein
VILTGINLYLGLKSFSRSLSNFLYKNNKLKYFKGVKIMWTEGWLDYDLFFIFGWPIPLILDICFIRVYTVGKVWRLIRSRSVLRIRIRIRMFFTVFGPPGSGSESTSQRYGSGSFYHHAKIVRKTFLDSYYFVTFYL